MIELAQSSGYKRLLEACQEPVKCDYCHNVIPNDATVWMHFRPKIGEATICQGCILQVVEESTWSRILDSTPIAQNTPDEKTPLVLTGQGEYQRDVECELPDWTFWLILLIALLALTSFAVWI